MLGDCKSLSDACAMNTFSLVYGETMNRALLLLLLLEVLVFLPLLFFFPLELFLDFEPDLDLAFALLELALPPDLAVTFFFVMVEEVSCSL